LDNIKEIKIKYTYKPTKAQKIEDKKLYKKQLREISKFPPEMHSYRKKQLLQELSNNRHQKVTHERVTNLLVKRFTQKMDVYAQEYQKAYKAYQDSIKENLGIEEIENSKINAHKTGNYQRRLQKKAKLQKKQFKLMRKRILETSISPSKWTPGNEKMFKSATQKILAPSYDAFNYYGLPEYNRSLAWVEPNENSTTKESISVASTIARQNSPVPGETKYIQNRVPTVPPTQKKQSNENNTKGQGKQQQQAKQKPMTIKMRTPEQYRQRMSGGKKQKQFRASQKQQQQQQQQQEQQQNEGNKKNNKPSRKNDDKPVSPSIVNPGPATWVTKTEYPDNFAWGILQHQPNNNGNGNGGHNKRTGCKKNKDEALNLLFPKSAPNKSGKKPQQNNRKQNKKQIGYNISEKL